MAITLKANVSMELKYVITTEEVQALHEYVSTLDHPHSKFIVDTLNEKGSEEAIKRMLTMGIRAVIKDNIKAEGVTVSPAKVTFHD